MPDISTADGTPVVPVSKRSATEASRRELSEDASFGVGTLLVVEQSNSENLPRGVSYTRVHRSTGIRQHGHPRGRKKKQKTKKKPTSLLRHLINFCKRLLRTYYNTSSKGRSSSAYHDTCWTILLKYYTVCCCCYLHLLDSRNQPTSYQKLGNLKKKNFGTYTGPARLIARASRPRNTKKLRRNK